MSAAEEYKLVVLDNWTAGKILAWTLASRGQRAAVIERRSLGMPCLNIACHPSKDVIHGAKAASFSRRTEELGITKPRVSSSRDF
jgi:pyruvate/2-oxoglutarate dehydrogenase complex dihydrolipoamide dehydrogenase (E3) component